MSTDRKVILSKGLGPKAELQFFLDIQEAIVEGYRISEKPTRDDMSRRVFRGKWGRAVLIKGDQGVVDEVPQEAPEQPVVEDPEAPEQTPTEDEDTPQKVTEPTTPRKPVRSPGRPRKTK